MSTKGRFEDTEISRTAYDFALRSGMHPTVVAFIAHDLYLVRQMGFRDISFLANTLSQAEQLGFTNDTQMILVDGIIQDSDISFLFKSWFTEAQYITREFKQNPFTLKEGAALPRLANDRYRLRTAALLNILACQYIAAMQTDGASSDSVNLLMDGHLKFVRATYPVEFVIDAIKMASQVYGIKLDLRKLTCLDKDFLNLIQQHIID